MCKRDRALSQDLFKDGEISYITVRYKDGTDKIIPVKRDKILLKPEVDVYKRQVDIQDTLPEDVKDDAGKHINLSEYTLKESNILKYKRDSEGNIIYDGTTPRTEEKGYYLSLIHI